MIKDFTTGDVINCAVLTRSVDLKLTKKGKPYYRFIATDATGSIPAVIWDVSCVHGVEALADADVISISASVDEYEGNKQLTVSNATVIPDADKMEFCPHTEEDAESMQRELLEYLGEVQNYWCQKLIHVLIDNETWWNRFCTSSAAVSIHHDVVGGLLEHTLGVVRMSCRAADAYPWVNRDLVITAAFLHDIGKIKEIKPFPENTYTVFGNCVGHVVGSAMIVDGICTRIKDFPVDVKLKIEHCILAHHGQLEWGSPKVPALPEAWIISQMDNLDAKLKMFKNDCAAEDWSAYDRYLGTYTASGDFDEEK